MARIKNIEKIKTIKNLNNPPKEEFKLLKNYLFDANANGIIDTHAHYTSVTEANNHFDIQNKAQLKNVLTNLGLDINDVTDLSFKDIFNDRLSNMLYAVPMSYLVEEG
jgi:hypothetical protein